MLNFIPDVSGPARYRPGFKFLGQTKQGKVARLIPFRINSARAYMLEFTPGKMRVYKDESLLLKAPFDLLSDTSLLDDFTDGDFTSSPAWTPFVTARVNVVANALEVDAHDPSTGVVGGAARTPINRNIGTYQFDAEIEDYGHVMFFATTYTPTTDANGVTSTAATGYGINRAAAGNYQFGRFDGAAVFTNLLDLGVSGTGSKAFKIVRDSAGKFTVTVDGTEVGSVTDTTYTTVTYFALQSHTTDTKKVIIDNIRIPSAGAGDTEGVITAITNADPAVVTVSAVGDLADDDECLIREVDGMLEINERYVKLANNSGSDFDLVDPVTGNDIDSTNFGAYTANGRLLEIYEIDTPYFANDLVDLSVAVSARDGVMYIAHKKYEIRKLSVDSADNFTLTTYTRTNDPFVNKPATLNITDIDLSAEETVVHFANGSVIDENATYTFSGIVGTTELNGGVYRLKIPTGDFPTPRANLITTNGEAEVDSSSWTAYVSGGIATPDNEHPLTVAFFEARLTIFGTSLRVNSFFQSRAPDDNGNPRYDDFTGGTDPDDAVFFALAPTSGEIDAAAWVAGASKYLLAGTFGGPFRISGGGLDEPIAPDSINARQFDTFGCEATPPALYTRPFWIQRGGTTVRTVFYDGRTDDLKSYDLLLNADQIADSRLQQVVIQRGRPDVLWVRRADGILAGMTVQGDENVAGWHRQKIGGTGAKVIDVATLGRTDKDDQLWVVTERTVNGVTRRFVEVWTDEVAFPDPLDFYTVKTAKAADEANWRGAVYRRQEEYRHLDAAATFDGSDRGTAAEAAVTPGALTGTGVTFTSDEDVFEAADVGKEIWKKPGRDTGVGTGRATITAFTSATEVTVDIIVDFDSADAIPAGDWYFADTTIYGLSHLDGATVQILTDGAPGEDKTIADGKITLDEAAAVLHAGFSYEGFIQTHNLEIGGRSGPGQTKPRNIADLYIRFLNTLGVDYGTDIYDLNQIHWRDVGNVKMDRPAPVFTGVRQLKPKTGWDHDQDGDGGGDIKTVFIVQRQPLPCIAQFIDIRYDATEET